MTRHAVLLGDPAHFSIRGGLNPYTRDRWGRRKIVDAARANAQWLAFRDTLERLGARVFVLPAREEFPATVFPANAGFLHPKYDAVPFSQKTFYLSRPAGHRAGEPTWVRRFLAPLGFRFESFEHLFEGEADFFPCGEFYIFTYGDIVKPGFRPRFGFPPYRFRFSHRSDNRNAPRLAEIVAPVEVIEVRLTDTRYYHGDTALFAFGHRRENLLAYVGAMDAESRERLTKRLGKRLVPLSRADAESFTANSFQMSGPEGPHILLPSGVSEDAKRAVRETGIPFTTVDVSEFFSKGGGSVKCMICDLGPVNE